MAEWKNYTNFGRYSLGCKKARQTKSVHFLERAGSRGLTEKYAQFLGGTS